MTTITRRYRFSASHRLHTLELSESENARLFGKCNNPFGHGHDYVLEVTASGPVDGLSGLIVPIANLDRLIDEQVLHVFASRNINLDLPYFENLVATTENIARVIAGIIRENWRSYIGDPAVRFVRIHVQETDRNGFELLVRDLQQPHTNDLQTENLPVHA